LVQLFIFNLFFIFSTEEILDDDEDKGYDETDSNNWRALQQSNITRWNSNAMLVNSFSKQENFINIWLLKMSHESLILSQEDKTLISELSEYFNCFTKPTKLFQGRKYATLHLICLIKGEMKEL